MRRVAVALFLTACGGAPAPDAETPDEKPPADALTRTATNGPVKATVRVWPAKPTLADPVHLRLEVEGPSGVRVDAPFQEAGDQRLGRFRVVGFTRDSAATADGGTKQEETYTLEAPSSGKQRIPALRLEMTDARDPAKPRPPEEILTDEIPLQIAPVPTEKATAPLHAVAGPLDAEVGGTSTAAVAAIAGGVLAAGIAGVWAARRHRERRRVAVQRTAYEVAVAHLAALAERGVPAADLADAWFVELSTIVRRYLESRYLIRAPELTTEEFLEVALSRPELTAEHRRRLTSFLEQCDRVKFAGHRPDAGESRASLDTARAFVEDTRLAEAPAP